MAFDKNVKATPLALEKLFEDVIAQDVNLYIDELKSGSLTEKIKIRFKLALQDHIEDESGPKLNLLSKLTPEKKQEIIAWTISAVVIYGLKAGIDKYTSPSDHPNINNQTNIILSQGQVITGIDKGTLNKQLRDSLEETPGAASGAIEFTRPAKKDLEASISMNNEVLLSKDSLAEIPNTLIPTVDEKSLELEDTEIIIRATDKDSAKRGWGATFPELSEKRMRVTVAPGIDLNELAKRGSITGNVSIFYTSDGNPPIINGDQ